VRWGEGVVGGSFTEMLKPRDKQTSGFDLVARQRRKCELERTDDEGRSRQRQQHTIISCGVIVPRQLSFTHSFNEYLWPSRYA
jgi:hypothetical protein